MMNEYQGAAAALLLRTLRAGGEARTIKQLRRVLPPDVVDAIQTKTEEYRGFNRQTKGNSADLSPDAEEYWKKALKMLRFGRLYHSNPDQGAREKALSRMCERLEETFEQLVLPRERGKFIIYDVNSDVWDDRWHACIDWNPPILKREFIEAVQTIDDPAAEAQIGVLRDLVEPIATVSDSPGLASPLADLIAKYRAE